VRRVLRRDAEAVIFTVIVTLSAPKAGSSCASIRTHLSVPPYFKALPIRFWIVDLRAVRSASTGGRRGAMSVSTTADASSIAAAEAASASEISVSTPVGARCPTARPPWIPAYSSTRSTVSARRRVVWMRDALLHARGIRDEAVASSPAAPITDTGVRNSARLRRRTPSAGASRLGALGRNGEH
jgi:hypothetical protein